MVLCRRIAFYFGVGYFSGIGAFRAEEFDNFAVKELEYGQFNIGYRQFLGNVLARHFRHESVLRQAVLHKRVRHIVCQERLRKV